MRATNLQKEGYKVKTASKGREGVEAVETADFQLILMDIMMPIMDGREATGIIKRMSKGSSISIVACTGSAVFRAMAPESIQMMGFAYCIHKPIDLNLIFQANERYASE